MNIFLSIIVCIAMLCSPGTALPAQPETAATYTVRNLTIGIGDESVTLAPEARITTAVGTEKAALHFEIGSGEEALMPMSGELTADGLKFSIGNEDHCYTISNETLMEVTGMTAEDAALLTGVGDLLIDYGSLIGKAMDPGYTMQYQDEALQCLADTMGATPEATEVQVEGETLPATRIAGSIRGENMLDVLDIYMTCGIPELEAFVADALGLINLMLVGDVLEAPAENFAALKPIMGGEMDGVIIEMDMVYTDDASYSRSVVSMNVYGEEITTEAEVFERDGEGTMLLTMGMETPEAGMSYDIEMHYTGNIMQPDSMDLVYDVVNTSGYSYEGGEGEEAYTYSETNEAIMHMEAKTAVVDGLESGSAKMTATINAAYGYDGEMESYTTATAMDVDYSERREEDGSITGSYAMAIAVEDSLAEGLAFNLSFDMNRSEGAYVDYFEGDTEYEITADFNEESDGYTMLMSDVLLLSADAVTLSADDSVMALGEMFGAVMMEAVEAEYGLQGAASLEEAAKVYGGEIPAFATPEGYVLESISANEYNLTMVYASGEDSFELVLANYGAPNSTSRYIIGEAGMERIDGSLVEMETDAEGRVYYVTIEGTDGLVFFYFNGVEEASALEIISGLEM